VFGDPGRALACLSWARWAAGTTLSGNPGGLRCVRRCINRAKRTAGLASPLREGLSPELVEFVLVGVERPGLGNLAVPNVEHQDGWAASGAAVAFGVGAVERDGMLVVGHHVVQGGPEGSAGTLGERPKKPSTWSKPW
jgi:hypothetical protein